MRNVIIFLTFCLFSLPTFAIDYGIDRLEEPEIVQKLEKKSLAVLTHSAARAKSGQHLIDILHKGFKLKKIFAPEHGLRTTSDDWVEDGVDVSTGLPVISLYKRNSKAPTPSDLKGIDAIVVDLQDVGVRYYTYFSTVSEVMKAAAPLKIEIIILDRPNLLGGTIIEGKTLDQAIAGGFASYYTIPTRHGMTLGELARMINDEKKVGAKLTIVPATGWGRENLLINAERPWIPPSPALVTIDQVGLYAMWGTLENFNLSVGRGQINDLAFRVLGAPWITSEEAELLAKKLNALNLKGIGFIPYSWQVTRAIHSGKVARGVKIEWDGREVRTDEFTYKVAAILVDMFKDRINAQAMSPRAYGSQEIVDAIRGNKPWEKMERLIEVDIKEFKERRKPFLIY